MYSLRVAHGSKVVESGNFCGEVKGGGTRVRE